MDETTPLLQSQQHHSLSQRRLLVVFPALALIHFTSFLDQTAISTSLPAIASALGLGASSVSLVGASFLITSTSIQLINGRLSDIFGRKAALVAALAIMGAGNLWSGFAATGVQLFVARAFTGFGAGAINALVQIAIADITTLEQRGYYFGMVGMAVAAGNGLGPLVGGGLTQTIGWQWAFWFVCPLCVVGISYLMAVWPSSRSGSASASAAQDRIWDKLKLVDWAGAWASLFSIALLLIPISQCGSTMSWASPAAMSMLIAGTMLFGVFLAVEWRFAKLPLLPARLFYYNRSTNILIGANILIGWIYWGNLFLLPLYLQNVRGASPAQAGVLMLPMVITHGLTSGLTGVLISMLGHYKPIIVAGAVCWALGALAKTQFDQATPIWQIVVVGVLDGIGVGCSLQPVLIGMLAGSDTEDRAVLTGLRNFVRDMGGATGTTVSGTILSNVLSGQLRGRISDRLIGQLISSPFALEDLPLTGEERDMITRAHMAGFHAAFTSFAVLTALHLFSCVWIRDYGLKQGKARQQQQEHVEEERVQSSREEQNPI
ncbi:major facilitator superfamily transporter [Chaetomidium leptoderma]|uniref:Major facilitator superfamily transporter n=1 Tax=Chaetomidium leptoderma TaxID=669021 RepID=A0AAN6VKB5_9PEZI|nr:major facilitator superfamily transporter [Chaetomidium leptoderma]